MYSATDMPNFLLNFEYSLRIRGRKIFEMKTSIATCNLRIKMEDVTRSVRIVKPEPCVKASG